MKTSSASFVCLLLVLLVLNARTGGAAPGDVVIINDGTYTYRSGGYHDIGQSFIATTTGQLLEIGVAVVTDMPGGTATLKVYEGEGMTGTVLYTKTGVDLSTVTVVDKSTYTFLTIPIDSTVDVVNGNVYTFHLTPQEAYDLAYMGSDNYTGGNGYAFGSAQWWDVAFRVTIAGPPPTAPGAPTAVSAVAGDGQAVINFTAPASDGGAAITTYTATANPGGLTGTCAGPLACAATVSGLTNGTAYTFTVTATNSAGTGTASAPSNSVTPQASQTITFVNPGSQNFGTTPTLSATASSGLTPVFTSSTTSVCTITSGGTLTFLTAGTCTINADQAGNATYGAAPQVSRSFTVNPVVPSAPAIGTATAGDGEAKVSFSAPANIGGAAITGYAVKANPGGKTATGGASPIVVEGLTNGTAYTFTVTATNSAGTSAPSAASASVTPAAAQTITFPNPGPQDFGTTPTLSASATSGLTPTFTSATAAVCTITPGGQLTFVAVGKCTIRADQAGDAAHLPALQVSLSFAVNAVTPGAPTIGAVAADNGSVSVSFAPPAFTGGAPITGYTVSANPGGKAATGSASPIVVTGLTNGTAYTFSVTAINSVGAGAASAWSAPVTPAAPVEKSGAGDTPSPAPKVTPNETCTVSLSRSDALVSSSGGLGVLTLDAPPTCTWTAASSAPWLVVGPKTGTGPAALAYVVHENTDAGVREATVTVTSATSSHVRVAQQGRGGFHGAPLELSANVNGHTLFLAWQTPAHSQLIDHLVEAGSAPGQSDLGTFRTGSGAAGFAVENMPAGTFYLRVRGIHAAGTTDTSNEVVVIIGDAVASGLPTPPTSLMPLVVDGTRPGVRWSSPVSGNATSYIVEFGSSPGASDLARVEVADLRFQWDPAIEPAHEYYVRVRAANSSGTSAPSNEVVMSRAARTAQSSASPQGLTASYDQQTQMLRADWMPPADGGNVTGYVVELGTLSGAANLLQTTTAATSWTQPAPPGNRYYLRVRAIGAAGPGPASNEAVVFAGAESTQLPGIPEQLTAQLAGGRLTLQWAHPGSGGPVGDYVIEAGSAPGLSDVASFVVGGAQTIWTYDGVPPGRTFYIRVRARSAVGAGPASAEVRVGQ